ncbi:Protein-glutamate methylesterase/protein-glutamine glutaminase [Dyadobacter sp. CECT 9623]|uniref:protein-glutamate methylesterase n=1 Tax=Dyadobacter linearis TaxID=2823330 RepID=A0ABN7RC65_9BACT|nr:chemotaxis protein CheB [Dyadobacter sp. CECT 9623]CAG5072796.1 Protein-glutamate methylesterase/protein-glutamine glutaminase [Dyadobacter sp. CECT 9623]
MQTRFKPEKNMTNPYVIVIGSSAGGVAALQQLVAGLPSDFQVPIFIVQHVAADSKSHLPDILTRTGPLPARHPKDGQPILPGNIYLAPPNQHMLIEDGRILVKHGPKENRFRPSIDALFRSAAYSYGTGVIGVVLTGMLDDGTSGMWSVQRMGGVTIVQEPADALYASMPSSVLQYVNVDHVVPLDQISALLVELTTKAMRTEQSASQEEKERLKLETDIAAQDNGFEKGVLKTGEPSHFSCPDCGGAMVQINEGKIMRFRCHTGHGYSSGSLLHEIRETIEKKLWQSVRSLDESIMLLNLTANNLAREGDMSAATELQAKAQLATKSVNGLRAYIYEQVFEQGSADNAPSDRNSQDAA